jgi:hypothetical protein
VATIIETRAQITTSSTLTPNDGLNFNGPDDLSGGRTWGTRLSARPPRCLRGVLLRPCRRSLVSMPCQGRTMAVHPGELGSRGSWAQQSGSRGISHGPCNGHSDSAIRLKPASGHLVVGRPGTRRHPRLTHVTRAPHCSGRTARANTRDTHTCSGRQLTVGVDWASHLVRGIQVGLGPPGSRPGAARSCLTRFGVRVPCLRRRAVRAGWRRGCAELGAIEGVGLGSNAAGTWWSRPAPAGGASHRPFHVSPCSLVGARGGQGLPLGRGRCADGCSLLR